MIPREKDGKTPWPHVKAQIKLQEIRAEVIALMRARDAEHGIGPDGKVYSEMIGDGGTRTAVIDPVKAAHRHSGEDTVIEIQERWYAFCSEPQDSSLVDQPPRRPIRKRKEESRPAGFPVPVDEEESAPPRRGPGRPRKEAFASL